MKKLIMAATITSIFIAVLFAVPTSALANNGKLSMNQLENSGWLCFPAGEPATPHCVNPGTFKSNNQATMSVLVFDNDGNFLGTEILWMAHIYNGQPCPQDEILDLGFAFACHHYAQ
jgi:hypothetical protein